MSQQNDITLDRVQQALGAATADQDAATQLLADPAAYFRQHGLDLSQGRDAEFNKYFHELEPGVTSHFSAVAQGQAAEANAVALSGIGCLVCKAGVFGIAGAIVALGVAGLASITPETEVVLLLARFAGLDARAVAGFISGLGPKIGEGVNSIATEICRWIGSC
jgi:hypothetical protein